jgi:hypothetical protein
MAAADKLLEKMRRNPKADWTIADLQNIAKRNGIGWRAAGGSHVIFLPERGPTITVPARRPIKPVYVEKFVEMIDKVRSEGQ